MATPRTDLPLVIWIADREWFEVLIVFDKCCFDKVMVSKQFVIEPPALNSRPLWGFDVSLDGHVWATGCQHYG